MSIKLRDKSTGVIIEVNPEAFAERGQDCETYIEDMKKVGFEVIS